MGADPLNYDIDFDIMIYFALCMYMHRGTLVYKCFSRMPRVMGVQVGIRSTFQSYKTIVFINQIHLARI